MKRKKHLIFVVIMSIIFALVAFVPTFLVDTTSIKEGYFILMLIAILFLILFCYRKLNYVDTSFRKLISTGSSIVFFGMILYFVFDRMHLSIIGEEGIQEIVDCRVEKRIKEYEGNKTPVLNAIGSTLLGTVGLLLLVFIFSLILRTDKIPEVVK